MENNKYRGYSLVCIVVLIIIIIWQTVIIVQKKERHIQSDAEYKIFFGKWQITEFMGRSRYCLGEKQDVYLGNTIYYDSESIKINDVTVLKSPVYQFGIIPNDKCVIYTRVRPAEGGDILWGEEDGFFVHVRLKQLLTDDKDFFDYGECFYIVNENVIILDTEDGWYKAERIEYIEDYPDAISFMK